MGGGSGHGGDFPDFHRASPSPRHRVAFGLHSGCPLERDRVSEEGLGALPPGPRPARSPLLPARPHLWPRRQARRDSCISRRPPLGSWPRLAFSASRSPAARPRRARRSRRRGIASPPPARRPHRPAGRGRLWRLLGKISAPSRRSPPTAALAGSPARLPGPGPGPAAPPSPAPIAEERRRGPRRREFDSRCCCRGFPGARAAQPRAAGPGLDCLRIPHLIPGHRRAGRAGIWGLGEPRGIKGWVAAGGAQRGLPEPAPPGAPSPAAPPFVCAPLPALPGPWGAGLLATAGGGACCGQSSF